MIEAKTTFQDTSSAVTKAADAAIFKNEGHAAATISRDAKASITTSPEPAQPGKPPHSRRGKMRRAIRYDVDKQSQSAVIGPLASEVGVSGAAHELGESIFGRSYEERPFMGPSLEKNAARFSGSFEASIAE